MTSKFMRSRRKLLGIVILCTVLIAGLTGWLQTRQVAEAALINPHPGLMGWWRFDEGIGSVAGDSSGNGNNGTIYGATWVSGRYGQALNFDGLTNYVQMGYSGSLAITNAITILAWINPTTLVGTQTIYAKGFSDGSKLGIVFEVVDNFIWFLLSHEATWTYVTSAGVLSSGWNRVAAVWDGSTMRIYINGVADINTASFTQAIESSANDLHRVGRTPWGSGAFNGAIDEVSIYNRALSAAEIQVDFQKNPDFSSMVLAKVAKGTTQVITTFSWQGIGSINFTMISPSQNYTEDIMPVYQKTVYSMSGGTSNILNVKRLSISINALSSDQNWYVALTFDNVDAYQVTVEVQK